MRFAWVCLLVACSAPAVAPRPAPARAPAAARASDAITFTRLPPKVGEVTEEIEERRLTLHLTDGTRLEDLETVEERHTVLTVLAVDDGLPIRARIVYERHRHEPPKEKVVLEGRTFVIERRDGDLLVTDPDDAPLEEPVRAFVARDFARFGTQTGINALPTTPLRVGERAASFERSMRRELAARAPGQLKDLTVKLVEVKDTADGKVGVFVAEFTAEDPSRDMTMKLRAEIAIRARDGAIASSVITGPMQMGGTVNGTGTVRMVSEYSYR